MTRKEFIKVLIERHYPYSINKDRIVITGRDIDLHLIETIPPNIVFDNSASVNMTGLRTLPSGIIFNNRGSVYLPFIKKIPADTEFNNGISIDLNSLENIPSGVKFNNIENIYLRSLKTISPDVEFNNRGNIYFGLVAHKTLGQELKLSELTIKGIDTKKLLNKMIKRSVFV